MAQKAKPRREDGCCVICFEPGQFVPLPCACHVNYCIDCWDRALASSVLLRGQAQCPSCRAAFHADFDSAAGGLVFSAAGTGNGAPAEEWQHEIYVKARPAQVQLLQSYGSKRRRSKNLVAGQDIDGSADAESASPLCVCGAELQRVGCKRRMERMLEDSDPEWRARTSNPDRILEQLVISSVVTCDLCNDVATRTGCVWTCTKGSLTVLHLAAYDVCEQCFAYHTGAGTSAATGAAKQVLDDVGALHQVGESEVPSKVARTGDHVASLGNQEAMVR